MFFLFRTSVGIPRSSDCEDALYDLILLVDDIYSRDGYEKKGRAEYLMELATPGDTQPHPRREKILKVSSGTIISSYSSGGKQHKNQLAQGSRSFHYP